MKTQISLRAGTRLLITMVLGTALAPAWSFTAQVPAAAEPQSDAAVRAYWTSERLGSAKHMEHHPSSLRSDGLPLATATLSPESTGLLAGAPEFSAPGRPTVSIDLKEQLYTPKDIKKSATELGVTPDSNSSFGYPFTETPVFPLGSQVENYPYSASGHLFFTITKSGGIDAPGNYSCSASIVQHRILITAGHCLGSPVVNGQGFNYYTNWLFIPADINGTAPFGSWTWNYGIVASGWYNGGGSLPNSEDWAFLILNDNNGVKAGSEVGWLGSATYALSGNNVTELGYPCNLDSCEYMQQTQAQVDASGGSNTYITGSAGGGGASGGPWVLDFGAGDSCSGNGCPTGLSGLGGNYVVAVTSYDPSGTVGYLGASQFNSDFSNEFTTLCNRNSGNC